jgi:hypothetical membrane protein
VEAVQSRDRQRRVPGVTSSRQRLFLAVMAGCVQFVVLTVIAMLVYPGGTAADPSARGYAFFTNFFSDLGRTEARSGAPNTVSAILFFLALTLAGLGLVVFFAATVRFFRQVRFARILTWLGSGFGVVSGLAFAGIACTPANLYLKAHGTFVEVAFLAFFIAVLFYIPAILLTRTYPNRYALAYALFGGLLAAYLWLLFFGPRLDSPQGLLIQATGQKIIVYTAIFSILFQAAGARRLEPGQTPPQHTTD